MKINLSLLILLTGFWSTGRASGPPLLFSSGDTITYTGPLISINKASPDFRFSVTNNSGLQDTMFWKAFYANFDSGWQLSFCDPNVCNSYIDTSVSAYSTRSFPAAPGVVQGLYFSSLASCIPGTGELQILMWLQHDSAASATLLTYISTFAGACGTAAINQLAGDEIKIYPTPVNTELTVAGLAGLTNAHIYVYDMLGNILLNQGVNNGKSAAMLNTSALHPGVYIVGVESAGVRVLTRRIEKLD